jgi:hypothetical protein
VAGCNHDNIFEFLRCLFSKCQGRHVAMELTIYLVAQKNKLLALRRSWEDNIKTDRRGIICKYASMN